MVALIIYVVIGSFMTIMFAIAAGTNRMGREDDEEDGNDSEDGGRGPQRGVSAGITLIVGAAIVIGVVIVQVLIIVVYCLYSKKPANPV